MILVDSSVWIDFLNGENSAPRRLLHRLIEDDGELALTGIILTEVLQGITEERDFRRVQEYLLAFPIYQPQSTKTYLAAARIYRACREKGETVRKTVDCLIAAICLEHNLILLHKDRDFDRIAKCTGLRCYGIDDGS
jgi:predicted nucleic acid-binding protein